MKRYSFILVVFFLNFCYSQNNLFKNGYYIKIGQVVDMDSTKIIYKTSNLLFVPKKKIKKNKVEQMTGNLNRLKKYGKLYTILPNDSRSIKYIEKRHDSIYLQARGFYSQEKDYCINLSPINIVNFNLVQEIQFKGIETTLKEEELIKIFSVFDISRQHFGDIEVKTYTSFRDSTYNETKVFKRQLLFDYVKLPNNTVKTIFIYDCKISNPIIM